jgi:3-methyladenine DNA glycosylase AlkD
MRIGAQGGRVHAEIERARADLVLGDHLRAVIRRRDVADPRGSEERGDERPDRQQQPGPAHRLLPPTNRRHRANEIDGCEGRLGKLVAMDARAVADRIDAGLRQMGRPERAETERRYLKSELTHYGVTVWQVRKAVREVRDLDHDELVDLVTILWEEPVHERRAAAAFLLDAQAARLTPADFDLLERLIRESKTWALVDVLADDVAGALRLRYPEVADTLRRWARVDDFWVRRSALLAHLVPLRKGDAFPRDFAAFCELADPMAEEKEFFVRKAIGWVLREVGKKHAADVYAWTAPRTQRLSGVSVREAVKYLPEEQREALLAAYRERRPLRTG